MDNLFILLLPCRCCLKPFVRLDATHRARILDQQPAANAFVVKAVPARKRIVQPGLEANGALRVDAVDRCLRGRPGRVGLLARGSRAADVKDGEDDAEGWHVEMETTRAGLVFKAV